MHIHTILSLLLTTLSVQVPAQDTLPIVRWTGQRSPQWQKVRALKDEQKYQEALKVVEQILEQARKDQDSQQQTQAMIEAVRLQTGLHAYETAVRWFADQPWPQDLLGRTAVQLYYSGLLQNYLTRYMSEIAQRQPVISQGPVDLKAMTKEQIMAAASAACLEAFRYRSQLGDQDAELFSPYLYTLGYPRHIIPTLRDVVCYYWVELLADKKGWTGSQANDVYTIDLQSLLGAARPLEGDTWLSDPNVHPVRKVAAILADLEYWHLQSRRLEAALEARFALLRRLWQWYTVAQDRDMLKAHLQDRLESSKGLSWWAVGIAQMARWVQEEDDPNALVRARQIALEGMQRFPDSVGGLQCRSIVESIEQPAYSIEAMASDGPGRPSILVSHRNLRALHFRAYKLDLEETIRSADDYTLLAGSRQVEALLKQSPTATWRCELPETPDYRQRFTPLTPPLREPGLYVIVASGRPDFSESENYLTAAAMVITDLVLVTRNQPGVLEAIVLSGSTGRPVASVDVTLYRYDWRNGHKASVTVRTSDDGIARFERTEPNGYFLLARKGKDAVIDASYLYLHGQWSAGIRTGSLIYTDRSIYRPGQTIMFKTIVYRAGPSDTDRQPLPRKPVTVRLFDANRQEVAKAELITNDHGTASGTLKIPMGRMLGRWYLEASHYGRTEILIEEYKRPTFELTILDPNTPLRLNMPATIEGQAKYYFGMPVTSGKVRWRVERTAVLPWWWCWRPGAGWTQTQLVAAGSCATAADGSFRIKFIPKADERLGQSPELYYNYLLTVELTDEGGETRSASKQFKVGFATVQARIWGSKEFFVTGEPIRFTIERTSLDNAPIAGEGTWRLIRLQQPGETLLPADQPSAQPSRPWLLGPRTRWNHGFDPRAIMRLWADGQELASGQLAHGKTGKAELELGPLPAGAYRLRYATTDPYGRQCQASHEFLCAGTDMRVALPAVLLVDKQTVKVGQTLRILVHSGLADQVLILETQRDRKVIGRQFLQASRSNPVLEIPITEADRGGFSLVLLAVRDHQVMELIQHVHVPWDNRTLQVAFSRFRDLLRPGQKETWTVRGTGPGDVNVPLTAVEVLAYMYDRSLDLFTPHRPPDPLSLWPDHRGTTQATRSVKAGPRIWVRCQGFRIVTSYPALVGPVLALDLEYGIGGPGVRGRLVVKEPWPTAMVAQQAREVADAADRLEVGDASPRAMPEREAMAAPTDLGQSQAQTPLRTDFSETAFFQPHLVTGPDGCVEIEFQVPQSLTSWSVWAHAIAADLSSGSANQQARTAKDLMVRPYLPRFLREGDQARLQIVINNAGDAELSGMIQFDIVDPETEKSLLEDFGLGPQQANAPFTAPAGGSTSVSFTVKTPARVGLVAIKATASSGILSDGELRPIPILPGRMHLMQSRFVALKGAQKRTMTFEDMSSQDPTRINEQLVVTVDAQLFYSVLAAMPYLLEYPYECTEQLFNRYLASGILSSMYNRYPEIAQMARQLSVRDTPLERFDQPDANRRMALEETPWLRQAMGQTSQQLPWFNVLKPEVAKEQMEIALSKLQQTQTSSGGFPWFAGGPPSPYITLYILHGFSRALEFGIQVPRQTVERAWQYMHRHYIDEMVTNYIEADRCWELVTFLNYILSNYPDVTWTKVFTEADRTKMLDFSFRHWQGHSPMLKGYLALTLNRAGRKDDALLVWQSVMDSAKTEQDLGTFWAPEDRAWLWYNDTIETHAFAIRTLMELAPQDQRLEGLVTWLLLNKKLNHWKSTKATSEVVYSLARYMSDHKLLGIREAATVRIGQFMHEFVFEPNVYTGRSNQIVLQGPQIDPVASAGIQIEKSTDGIMFASATWHFSTEMMPQTDRGDLLSVERTFFKVARTDRGTVLVPLTDGARIEIGDLIEVHISLRSKHPVGYVHLRDPRPAGCEPMSLTSGHRWNLGICWYEEVRDSGMNFFFEQLPQGDYPLVHRLRASTAGMFKVAPATVQPMYAPEFAAYSSGATISISERAK